MKFQKNINVLQNTNSQIDNGEKKKFEKSNKNESLSDKYDFDNSINKKLTCDSCLTVSNYSSMDISTTMSLSSLSLSNSNETQNESDCIGFNKTKSVFNDNFNDTMCNSLNNMSMMNSNNYFNSFLLKNSNSLTTNLDKNKEKISKDEFLSQNILNNNSFNLNYSFSTFNDYVKNNTVPIIENACCKTEIDNIFFIEYTSNYQNLQLLDLICFTITWIQSRIYEIILSVPNLRYLLQYTLQNNYLQYAKCDKENGKLTKSVIKSNDPLEVIKSMEFLDISFYKNPLHRHMLIHQLLNIYNNFVSLYLSYYDLKLEKTGQILEENKLLHKEFMKCNEERINIIKSLNDYF
uniref:Transcription factor with AP2 domain(S) n=1 Tax=Strongyloides stercoralis TaxID=6248 RepID=A0A0K0EED5_STRER